VKAGILLKIFVKGGKTKMRSTSDKQKILMKQEKEGALIVNQSEVLFNIHSREGKIIAFKPPLFPASLIFQTLWAS